MEHRSTFAYRPEIDGLRALAILPVLVFHLNKDWLPGGFTGVDVFFVISGYLIIRILLHDHAADGIDFWRFYQRRIARLLPLLFTVVTVTLVAAMFVQTPRDYATVGAAARAAAIFLINIKLAREVDYFDIAPDSQPLTHLWSLAVEEQFYIIFPVFMLFGLRMGAKRIFELMIAVFLGSLVICIVTTYISRILAFHLLPTRAWELLAGCLIAVAPQQRLGSLAERCHGWLPAAGLAALVATFLLLPATRHFPGLVAAIPVAATAAIIAGSARRGDITAVVLALPPLVFVGKLSYALYLWHWPVFALLDYRFPILDGWLRLTFKLALTMALAVASHKLLEVPARTFLARAEKRHAAYGFMLAGVALLWIAGTHVRNTSSQYRFVPPSAVAGGGTFISATGATKLAVIIGDSNAAMYGKSLIEVCAAFGCNLHVAAVQGGDTLPQADGRVNQIWQDTVRIIEGRRPDVVVMGSLWHRWLAPYPARLTTAIAEIAPHVGHIVILNQPPVLPRSARREEIRRGARPPFREEPETAAARARANAFIAGLAGPKVVVLDVARHFELSDGSIRMTGNTGLPLFDDETHLSAYGTAIIEPELLRALTPR